MKKDKRPVDEKYSDFMGRWLAGSSVAYFVGKIVGWILAGWFIYEMFLKHVI